MRLHYRVEVWRSRGGWFDAFERQAEWDVVLRHEPLLDQYTVLTLVGDRVQERRYATIDALSAALAFAYQVSVRPAAARGATTTPRRSEISTLSDSDLDELQRFLEGDLGDVAQGKERRGRRAGPRGDAVPAAAGGAAEPPARGRSSHFRRCGDGC